MIPRVRKSVLLLVTLGLSLVPSNVGDARAQPDVEFEAVVAGIAERDAASRDLSHLRREGSFDLVWLEVIARRGDTATSDIVCEVQSDLANPIRYRARQNIVHGRGHILTNPTAASGAEATTGTPCVVDIVEGVEDSHHVWPNNHSPGQFHREGTLARVELKIRVVTGGFDHHYCVRGSLAAVPDGPTTVSVVGGLRGNVVARDSAGRCPEHELRRDLPPEFSDRFHG